MFKLMGKASAVLALAVALPAKAQMIVAVYSYSGPTTAVPTLSTPLLAALALLLGVVAARLLRQNGVKASSALMLVLSVGIAGVALNSARSDASGIIVNVSGDCQTGGTSSFYYPDTANFGGTYFQNSCSNAITIESIDFTTGSCVLVPATNREAPDLPDCTPGLELAPGGRCDHLICQISS